jgi:hypothetical protein
MYLAMVRRHNNRERMHDYRAAVVACSISGAKPEELFPSLRPKPLSPDALRKRLLLAFGGPGCG